MPLLFKDDSKHKKASNNHKFDKECNKDNIKHRLTAPYTPATNGMVERMLLLKLGSMII